MANKNASLAVAFVLVAGPALVALIPMAAAPALVAMTEHFGASPDSQFFSQIVMTLPAVMLILCAPLAGWASGKIGQRAVLLGSLVLYIVGGAGVMLIDDNVLLIVLRLLLGIAGGGLLTTCLALIGDHFFGLARERLLGYATSAASLLAGLALIYGGRLVDVGGWQAPFALYLLAIPVLALAIFVIKDRPISVPVEGDLAKLPQGVHIAKEWGYFALLILLTLGMFTPAIQAGFVLADRGIGSAQTIFTIVAATSFVAMVSAWAFGHLRRWISIRGFLIIDALSMGVGILMIGMGTSTGMILAGCCLVGIGAGMSEPAIASLLFHRLPPVAHALAMGLIVSAINAGQFINPIVFEPLRRTMGASGSFVVVGAVFIGATFILMFRKDSAHIVDADPQTA